jgi:hypothetical protein
MFVSPGNYRTNTIDPFKRSVYPGYAFYPCPYMNVDKVVKLMNKSLVGMYKHITCSRKEHI